MTRIEWWEDDVEQTLYGFIEKALCHLGLDFLESDLIGVVLESRDVSGEQELTAYIRPHDDDLDVMAISIVLNTVRVTAFGE